MCTIVTVPPRSYCTCAWSGPRRGRRRAGSRQRPPIDVWTMERAHSSLLTEGSEGTMDLFLWHQGGRGSKIFILIQGLQPGLLQSSEPSDFFICALWVSALRKTVGMHFSYVVNKKTTHRWERLQTGVQPPPFPSSLSFFRLMNLCLHHHKESWSREFN